MKQEVVVVEVVKAPKEEQLGLTTVEVRRKNETWYSLLWWAVVSAILALCFGCAFHGISQLPSIVSPEEVIPGQFSESRARDFLSKLIAIGPHHHAMPTLHQAVSALISELETIKAATKAINSAVEIEYTIDWNVTVGEFLSGKILRGFPALVVRLSNGTLENKNNSLLIDAHIDSQLFTTGSADNSVSVSNSIEIIKTICFKPSYPWRNSLIFVFSCEEDAFGGAVFFNTQHPWRQSVRAYIDLEAAGLPKRGEALLSYSGQTALDWYLKVPHPLAFSIFTDLYNIGILGASTDAYVYDHFKIPGLDLVYATDCWWYHTHLNEHLENITNGTMQHEGDNLLALIEEIAGRQDFNGTTAATNSKAGGISSGYTSHSLSLTAEWGLFAISMFCFVLLSFFIFLDQPMSLAIDLLIILVSFCFALASFLVGFVISIISTGLIACAKNKLAFNPDPLLFVSCTMISALSGCLIPYHFFYSSISSIISRSPASKQKIPTHDSLQWIVYIGVIIFQTLVFLIMRGINFGHSLLPLMDIVFGLVAISIGFFSDWISTALKLQNNRIWNAIFFALPVFFTVLPLFLWSGPAFQMAILSFVPILARLTSGISNLLVVVLLLLIGFIPSIPLVVVYQFGGKDSTSTKKSTRSYFTLFVNILAGIIVLALVIALLAKQPFTKEHPTRIGITHNTDQQGTSQIMITYPNYNSLTELQKYLSNKGIQAVECSAIGYGWLRRPGVCINTETNSVAPSNLTWNISTFVFNESFISVEMILFPEVGTSWISMILPCKPNDLVMDGFDMSYWKDTTIKTGFAFNASTSPINISFNMPKDCDGKSIQASVDSIQISKELQEIIDSLPSWSVLWGKHNNPGSSSHLINITIPFI